MSYPEHDRMKAVKDESQAIGEFLEWLQAKDGGAIVLAVYGIEDGVSLFMTHVGPNVLLANYFGIDLALIEEEKSAMLEELREANANNTPLQRTHQRGPASEQGEGP